LRTTRVPVLSFVLPVETGYSGVCDCGCGSFTPESAVFDTWMTSSVTPRKKEKSKSTHRLFVLYVQQKFICILWGIKVVNKLISQKEFITMSLDLNLFFLRIMKEHSFFLQIGFTPKDKKMGEQAAMFRRRFEQLLSEATALANGNVSANALNSRQTTTQYTLEAERLTNFYTGIPFNLELTRREEMLQPSGSGMPDARMEEAVERLDRRAYQLTTELASFKERLLQSVRSCKMFTVNYPLLIEHILREARHFMEMLVKLIRRESITRPEDLLNQEVFWNRQMGEHAKFIAGQLDPSEETLIEAARMFGREFDALTAEAEKATSQTKDIAGVTAESRQGTERLRNFKSTATKGILECKIQSIIIPLLGDHVLREANHYLCIMGMCHN